MCVLILCFAVSASLYDSLDKTIRVSIFETISALSTTGFSTVGYGNWNSLGWLILIALMLVGGGAGSTAGGIKQFRIYALFRVLWCEIKAMLLPKNTVTEPDIWQGDRRSFLNDSQIRTIALFVFLYFLLFGIGVTVITAYGYSIPESLFEYASVLSTVGLSVGVTAADAPTGILWTEVVGMFLGRLEFFTVFVGVIRIVRDFPTLFY